MKSNRILSTVLVAVMLFASVAGFLPVLELRVAAAPLPAVDEDIWKLEVEKTLKQSYPSAQDKLDRDPYMLPYAENEQYSMYANRFTGELYVKDKLSGQILNSNPYYIGANYVAPYTTPKDLMSQVIIEFAQMDGAKVTYNSYDWCTSRGQLFLTPIKGGVRFEYTIGDTTTRYLLPNGIMKEEFEEQIIAPAQEKLVALLFEMVITRVALDGEDAVQENIDEAKRNGGSNYRPLSGELADVLAYFEQYTNFGNIPEFKTWYDRAYLYYKMVCGRMEFIKYSEMAYAVTDYFSLTTFYQLQDPNRPGLTETMRQNIFKTYPATAQKNEDGTYQALYALDQGLSNKRKRDAQNTVVKYAPHYTLEMMFEDERLTMLEPEVEVNPVFRCALEYTLNETGFSVRLPANSVSYDETKYTLMDISVLKYMGSGNMKDGGYIFYPDGSGAVIDFDSFNNKNITLMGSVYGIDHAFHSVEAANEEAVRMPVYGTISTKHLYYHADPYRPGEFAYVSESTYRSGSFTYRYVKETIEHEDETTEDRFYYLSDGDVRVYVDHYWNASGTMVMLNADNYAAATMTVTEFYETHLDNGYLAILEEGAAMADLHVSINGLSNPYSSVFPSFNPIPNDSYELRNGGTTINFTVISAHKYQGSFNLRFVLLTDENIREELEIPTTYVADYVGMANAYRDYLTNEVSGILTALTEADINDRLPLYVETLGIMYTTKKFLTVPVTVNVPLTSFEDVRTMYEELSEQGITNVKFKLTGYANDGIYATYPVKIKWERAAGGKAGFRQLVAYAKQNADAGLTVFPEFDFLNAANVPLFSGIRLKRDMARTVDNRYANKRVYDGLFQDMDGGSSSLMVAPQRLTALFDKFHLKYVKFENDAVSVATAAQDLASDFNKESPTLREQSMGHVIRFLDKVSDQYGSVMSEGGNMYALQHIDYLLNAPIDSSHYRTTSYTVPFFGMVAHGFLQYAGAPTNEQGDPIYQILRSIESGASLYFILAYQNTELMKENPWFSGYYSVNYQIWKEDMLTYYNIINQAIGDLQLYQISHHQKISAERIVEEAEILANQQTLESEFLQQLVALTGAAKAAKVENLRMLHLFYTQSLDIIAQAHFNKLRQEDQANQGQPGYVPKATATLKQETKDAMFASFATYKSYLNTYKADEDLERFARNEIVSKLTDPALLAIIQSYVTDRVSTGTALITAVLNEQIAVLAGQEVSLSFDEAALIEQAKERFDTDELSEEFLSELHVLCLSLSHSAPGAAYLSLHYDSLDYDSAYRFVTYSYAQDKDYLKTDFTISDGTVVLVTYTSGEDTVHFVLNYNVFSVRINLQGYGEFTLEPMSFVRIN
ncbi:MAG: DUF5696 domain-containing protein [Eubacteriales bacterium]